MDGEAQFFNSSTDIILYMARLGARVHNYVTFLVDHAEGRHQCISSKLRGVEVTPDCLDALKQGSAAIARQLQGAYSMLLEDYLKRLDDQTKKDASNEKLIDRNSRLACDLHAHQLLMYRNLHLEELDRTSATTLVGSFVYLTTRHTWNKCTREAGRMLLPETELYELLQVQRRRLVQYLRGQRQYDLDDVMQTALQVSTSATGSLRASSEIVDAHNRWATISGDRSIGRFAVGSTRSGGLNPSPSLSLSLSLSPSLSFSRFIAPA